MKTEKLERIISGLLDENINYKKINPILFTFSVVLIDEIDFEEKSEVKITVPFFRN